MLYPWFHRLPAVGAGPTLRRLQGWRPCGRGRHPGSESVVVKSAGRSGVRAGQGRPTSAVRRHHSDRPRARSATLQDAARSRGASYVTCRRLAEGLGCPSRLDVIRAWLIQAHAERCKPPLWSVAA